MRYLLVADQANDPPPLDRVPCTVEADASSVFRKSTKKDRVFHDGGHDRLNEGVGERHDSTMNDDIIGEVGENNWLDRGWEWMILRGWHFILAEVRERTIHGLIRDMTPEDLAVER